MDYLCSHLIKSFLTNIDPSVFNGNVTTWIGVLLFPLVTLIECFVQQRDKKNMRSKTNFLWLKKLMRKPFGYHFCFSNQSLDRQHL